MLCRMYELEGEIGYEFVFARMSGFVGRGAGVMVQGVRFRLSGRMEEGILRVEREKEEDEGGKLGRKMKDEGGGEGLIEGGEEDGGFVFKAEFGAKLEEEGDELIILLDERLI